jgi:hypothetical protein
MDVLKEWWKTFKLEVKKQLEEVKEDNSDEEVSDSEYTE